MVKSDKLLFYIGIGALVLSVIAGIWTFVFSFNMFVLLIESGFFTLSLILLALSKFFDKETNEVELDFKGFKIKKKEKSEKST